ncbi:NAD(P)-binding domain-containing protein, partial [Acidipropionibacterium jensenii]|uniref:NAD(P)-binding domain-containing protein n=1 Tax=Acidipropionibacterium jensenii TaxID=1749 RepID=UPI0026471641
MNPQIAVLGCGTMAGAIVSGLLAAGTDPSRIVATARSSAPPQPGAGPPRGG